MNIFVGYESDTGEYIVFRNNVAPTFASHGHRFAFCGGAFASLAQAQHFIDVQRRGWQ